ncbi:MAG TPA: response regulator [Alphaproteobacteria bacterium]|nr:response regulator [Alphaproteobacteria bacterium]
MANNGPTSEKGRILLVDDEDGFRYTAEKALREAGYDVRIAGDYQKALDILAGPERLDLMLTDIVMPKGINGFALARMARMRRLDLKLLYVTSYDVPANEAVAKILRKPITETELVHEVEQALAA